MRKTITLALAAAFVISLTGFAQVGTRENPIKMVLVPWTHGGEIQEIGQQIAWALSELAGYYIEVILQPDIPAMIETFAASDGDVFGFPTTDQYMRIYERTNGNVSPRLAPLRFGPVPNECLAFGPGFPGEIADQIVEAIKIHIETDEGQALWGDPGFYGWTTVSDVDFSVYDAYREGRELVWTQIGDDGFGEPDCTFVSIKAIFNDCLYAGTLNRVAGGGIWVSDDGVHWLQVNENGFGDVCNAKAIPNAVYGECLYASAYNETTGTEVWMSEDGACVPSTHPTAIPPSWSTGKRATGSASTRPTRTPAATWAATPLPSIAGLRVWTLRKPWPS